MSKSAIVQLSHNLQKKKIAAKKEREADYSYIVFGVIAVGTVSTATLILASKKMRIIAQHEEHLL